MRLALISDLHANEIALDAVLIDAARAGYDQLVCLGDVATLGPRPREVLARLRDLACPCILGNHDEFMIDEALVRSYSESTLIVDSVDGTRASLDADELAFFRTFQRTLTLDDVFLFHGTPRSNMEDLLSITPPDEVDRMLQGHRAALMAGGHTHLPMVRQHRGMLLVNPGSLGIPFHEPPAAGKAPTILPRAEYAIVDVTRDRASVDLRRVAIDTRRLAQQVDGWDNPLAPSLRATYLAAG
jgi:putative phosphoesterase